MNSLELALKEREGDPEIKLLLDSVEFMESESVILEELLRSTKGGGEFLIFTCTCGIADCGGWEYVKVMHEENVVKWHFTRDEREYAFEFEALSYMGEIERMAFEIGRRNIKLSPAHWVAPE